MVYAVVKMRGVVKSKPDVRRTLELLNLDRTNHCVIIEDNEHYRGMLQKVKDYVAWGEINTETLTILLNKRGMLTGGRKLTDNHLKQNSEFEDIKSLAHAIVDGRVNLKSIPNLRPVLRLHPPRKGHKGIKKPFPEGVLGFHRIMINELLLKMR
jgi:large subunit ribosomal protein L30